MTAQAQPVLADFGRRSVHYEAFDRRAHRCKSSAVQINLFGAVLTVLRQAKAAAQIGLEITAVTCACASPRSSRKVAAWASAEPSC